MSLNPLAAIMMVIAWAVIGTTTVWCFYRMFKTNNKKQE